MKLALLNMSERVHVELLRSQTQEKLSYMKLSVLVFLDEGLTQQQTATLLGISDGTVYNCKAKYDREGLDKYLDRNYVPYTGRLKDEELAALEDEVDGGLYSEVSQVAAWIKQRFDVAYSLSGVRSILKKLDFVYKKTLKLPGKVDVEEQELFLAEFEPFLAEKLQEDEAIYFMDAVHPQHNTRSDYAWIKKGKEKQVPSNAGRQRININAAMNFNDPSDVQYVETQSVNAQSTQALLEKVLAKNPDKKSIYVILDNARYYYNAHLQEWLKANPVLTLIYLPPYSPNLNLIERLWKFLRKKVINLHYYPRFEEFKAAIFRFFDHLDQYKGELASLISPNFQRFAPSV